MRHAFFGKTHNGHHSYPIFSCVLQSDVTALFNGVRSPHSQMRAARSRRKASLCTRLRGCGPIDGSVSLTAAAAAASSAALGGQKNAKWPPLPAAWRTEGRAEAPSREPSAAPGLKEGTHTPSFQVLSSGPATGDGLPVKRGGGGQRRAGGRAVGGGGGRR